MKNFKILFSILFLVLFPIQAIYSQTTINPYVASANNNCTIEKIKITQSETIVYVRVPKSRDWGAWVSFSSTTVLVPSDVLPINEIRNSNLEFPDFAPTPEYASLYADAIKRIKEGREMMSKAGFLIRNLGPDQLDAHYKINQRKVDYFYFELHFDALPKGVENVYIRELKQGGFEWTGIRINNPFPNTPNTGLNEYTIKQKIDNQNDGIVGIYEGITENKYKLGCIKDNGQYKLIFLGSAENLPHWRIGDLKGTLEFTATPGFFKCNWYMRDKSLNKDWYMTFDGVGMKTLFEGKEDPYIKLYPTASSVNNIPNLEAIEKWTGSGFALNKGYLVTNYHVIEGAKSIMIKGVNGNFSLSYNAIVVASDKQNDLAILQINDSRFNGFGTLPYAIHKHNSEVGEEVFVLGYPLTATMGDEIKYTTGVISSKTGFQGDVSLYQISAPIQPGNSGGPLFDSKGNLIGIVSAKHKGTENVGYAIKTSYLCNLIESFSASSIIPFTNRIRSISRTEQIKSLQKKVFLIECSNKPNTNISTSKNPSVIFATNNSVTTKVSNEKITEHPRVEIRARDKNFRINRIITNNNETILEMTCNSSSFQDSNIQWCNISPDSYITAGAKKYRLIKSIGIRTAPEKTYFLNNNQDITFSLYFQPLLQGTDMLNFIDAEDGDWDIYGIHLE